VLITSKNIDSLALGINRTDPLGPLYYQLF
jgi:hypothetical protein